MLQGIRNVKLKESINKFIVSDSDHLTLLNVYKSYIENRSSKQFWRDNFINEKSLKKANQISHQLIGYLKNIKQNEEKVKEINEEENKLNFDDHVPMEQLDSNQLILKCLYEGLPLNIHSLNERTYRSTRSNEQWSIHPTSVLFTKFPSYVVWSELIVTSKRYMRFVSDITGVYVKDTSV